MSFIESQWCIGAAVLFRGSRGSESLHDAHGWLLHQPWVQGRIQAAAWNGREPRQTALHDAGLSQSSLCRCSNTGLLLSFVALLRFVAQAAAR